MDIYSNKYNNNCNQISHCSFFLFYLKTERRFCFCGSELITATMSDSDITTPIYIQYSLCLQGEERNSLHTRIHNQTIKPPHLTSVYISYKFSIHSTNHYHGG